MRQQKRQGLRALVQDGVTGQRELEGGAVLVVDGLVEVVLVLSMEGDEVVEALDAAAADGAQAVGGGGILDNLWLNRSHKKVKAKTFCKVNLKIILFRPVASL